jgi:heme/copper-type cytochrome/quinol oxidase subunit 4
MILTVLGLVLALIGLLADNLKGAAILGVLAIVLLLVTLVEFSEMRDRHRARRAIEQSAGANQPGPQPALPVACQD